MKNLKTVYYNEDKDYIKEFKREYARQKDLILSLCKKINENESISKDIKSFCSGIVVSMEENYKNILKAVTKYFLGDINSAIKLIKKTISAYHIKKLNDCYALLGVRHFIGGHDLKQLFMFKGRTVEAYSELKSNDMFHIPLDKREFVSTMRYSVPGIPCMYLASNSYVVWCELNKPDYSKLAISAVDLTSLLDEEIIDLSPNYHVLTDFIETFLDYDGNYESLSDYFEIYIKKPEEGETLYDYIPKFFEGFLGLPLSLATSMKCTDKNRIFKSEYIISQLVMYNLENAIGVAYRSNVIDSNHVDGVNLAATNLAIPITKYSNLNKYGNICNDIRITNSFNFENYRTHIHNKEQIVYSRGAKGFTWKNNTTNILYEVKPKDSKGLTPLDFLDKKSTFNQGLFQNASYDMVTFYNHSIYRMFDDFIIQYMKFNNIDYK